MYPAVGLMSLAAMLAAVLYGWRQMTLRQLALDRLSEPALATPALATLGRSSTRPLRRTWRWVPWLVGIVVGIVLYFFVGFWLTYSAAIGLIVGLLGAECERYLAQQRTVRIETQLADAIDLMI